MDDNHKCNYYPCDADAVTELVPTDDTSVTDWYCAEHAAWTIERGYHVAIN